MTGCWGRDWLFYTVLAGDCENPEGERGFTLPVIKHMLPKRSQLCDETGIGSNIVFYC